MYVDRSGNAVAGAAAASAACIAVCGVAGVVDHVVARVVAHIVRIGARVADQPALFGNAAQFGLSDIYSANAPDMTAAVQTADATATFQDDLRG